MQIKVTKGRSAKGAPKLKHAGGRKGKIQAYYRDRYPVTKMKRICLTQGLRAARDWAKERDSDIALVRVIKWWEAKQLKE